MQEKLMAIVKYASHIYPMYSVEPNDVKLGNNITTERDIPTAFLYCEAHYVDNLTGNIEIGGEVAQTKPYPAVDYIDNIMLDKPGMVMAIGYESFILELLHQPIKYMPQTRIFEIEW